MCTAGTFLITATKKAARDDSDTLKPLAYDVITGAVTCSVVCLPC